MPFSQLIGNDLAKAALCRMIEQKNVPNTLLFHGPDGVGKRQFALALAQVLMGPKAAAKIAVLNHPDLHSYSPEGKSATHPVENMRKLIEEVKLAPFEAPVNFFLIHDAHQMLAVSSNALLKTLEEPPAHAYFILLTNNADLILPTIVSRCRPIAFFPIPQAQIETFLQEKWNQTKEEARRIAFLSHGSLSRAHHLLRSHQSPWRRPLLDILSLHLPRDYPQLRTLLLELEGKCMPEEEGQEENPSILKEADLIFEEICLWYRDMHLLKEGIVPECIYHLDSIDRLQKASSLPLPPLEKVLEQVAHMRLGLQRNIALSTVLENFLLL